MKPCLSIANAYFAGFHCCEKASGAVATPWSPIPAARASAATKRKGTPVVITLLASGCCALICCNDANKNSIANFFIFIFIKVNKYSIFL